MHSNPLDNVQQEAADQEEKFDGLLKKNTAVHNLNKAGSGLPFGLQFQRINEKHPNLGPPLPQWESCSDLICRTRSLLNLNNQKWIVTELFSGFEN